MSNPTSPTDVGSQTSSSPPSCSGCNNNSTSSLVHQPIGPLPPNRPSSSSSVNNINNNNNNNSNERGCLSRSLSEGHASGGVASTGGGITAIAVERRRIHIPPSSSSSSQFLQRSQSLRTIDSRRPRAALRAAVPRDAVSRNVQQQQQQRMALERPSIVRPQRSGSVGEASHSARPALCRRMLGASDTTSADATTTSSTTTTTTSAARISNRRLNFSMLAGGDGDGGGSGSQRSMASSNITTSSRSLQQQFMSANNNKPSEQHLFRSAVQAARNSQRQLFADQQQHQQQSSSSKTLLHQYHHHQLAKQEEEERMREEELHTQRVAEEAQEEELVRLALERSLTDMGAGAMMVPRQQHHSQSLTTTMDYVGTNYDVEYSGNDTLSPGRGGRPAPFPQESVTIHPEIEDDNNDNFCSININDDDDDMSMFDMSPHEPASSARAERRGLHLDDIPPAPSLVQNNAPTTTTTTSPPGNTTNTDRPRQSPPTIGMSPPSSPTTSSVSPVGAFAVPQPAPKTKSPRTAVSTTSITGTSAGGTAIAIDSPAASITKSPEVRAAIVKHATSPAVFILPPKLEHEDGEDKSSNSRDDMSDAMVAVSDSSEGSATQEEEDMTASTATLQSAPTGTTIDASTPTNPWRKPTNPHDRSLNEEPTDDRLQGVEWPALGETPVENIQPATHPSTIERPEADVLGISGSNLSVEELEEIHRALKGCPHELEEIRWALRDSQLSESCVASNHDTRETTEQYKTETPPPGSEYEFSSAHQEYSEEDAAAIATALREVEEEEVAARTVREAEEEEERQSLKLALQMQREEEQLQYAGGAARNSLQNQGKIRTMTRAEVLDYRRSTGLHQQNSGSFYPSPDLEDEDEHLAPGFRMNSSTQQQWNRRDQNSVVGPNCEVRTKHDTDLDGEANAHRLGLDFDDVAGVGNTAYNAFMQSMKGSKKGVAKSGTGRAGSDVDATRSGAMDPQVRSVIARAINNEIIERCNGVVKEGKEAVIYHADRGVDSEGFDVAIKVFKRIQEFRGRGEYVDGDPRYGKTKFRNITSREQLEVWAEKEFRNLMRANKAGVPVPSPLFYKENVLFMRFLGSDGRPAPQLRELDLREGSKRWTTLYLQVLEAIKRLYKAGRLVHGDLSEYNILVVPASFVENHASGVEDYKELQAVLIDFGQAVDIGHPSAVDLLKRDLDHVLSFFSRKGVRTMSKDEALALLLEVN